jgi:putative transcriptional regulator
VSKLGKRLIRAAKEARQIARGEADPKSYRLHLPEEIDAKAIRQKVGLSQAQFARTFGIPKRTLQDWEQRRRFPDLTAQALLRVIALEPAAVKRALADFHPAE